MNNENTNPALLGKQQDLHPHRSHSNNNNNNNNNKNE